MSCKPKDVSKEHVTSRVKGVRKARYQHETLSKRSFSLAFLPILKIEATCYPELVADFQLYGVITQQIALFSGDIVGARMKSEFLARDSLETVTRCSDSTQQKRNAGNS